MLRRPWLGAVAAAAFTMMGAGLPVRAADVEGVPRYEHVFVIIEENKDYAQILDPGTAPHIAELAASYGNAANFFAEVHPSEANYVALLGGDTFGIHDDEPYYCEPHSRQPLCKGAAAPGYVAHTIHAPHLGDQLLAAGLSWKGYYENLPGPGSLAITASDPKFDDGTRKTALYAAKHSGFINFADVQTDPRRSERLVGFDQLERDLAANSLPTFALIVPNQCNEMHGLHGPLVPPDCDGANTLALIRRGDAYAGDLVRKLQASKAWASPANVAIVITFDESANKARGGCCGVTPDAPSNFGGGHIPTVVITNHGPRGVKDETPYNHYSLLRTLEDAFRLKSRLGHAADVAKGVRPMTGLFAVDSR